jgi:hypothetical protein
MSALQSQGILLKQGDGESPEVFTSIPTVTKISGPGGSSTIIDVSSLDSIAKEKMPGLTDNGDITFDFNFDPVNVQHKALITAKETRVLRNFKLVLNETIGSTASFAGYVTSIKIDAAMDAKVSGSGVITISGAVTWA